MADFITIIKKFAEDTKAGHVVVEDDDRAVLQKALDNLHKWAMEWGMSFNVSKYKVMHIGRRNPQFEYSLNGIKLEPIEEEKDIGVLIHSSLKPTKQCREAAKKANGVLTQIFKSFHYGDKKTFLQLYKTYVRCRLETSVPAWNPWLQQDKETLEKVQMRAVGMISGLQVKNLPGEADRAWSDEPCAETHQIRDDHDFQEHAWFLMSE